MKSDVEKMRDANYRVTMINLMKNDFNLNFDAWLAEIEVTKQM